MNNNYFLKHFLSKINKKGFYICTSLIILTFAFTFLLSPAAAQTWNVSYVNNTDGFNNVTNVSNITSISEDDIIRIWGNDGHIYEGGFTISANNVSIIHWDGSPEKPIITNTSNNASAITVTGNNVTLQGLNISGNNLTTGNGSAVYVNGSEGSPLQSFNITDCILTENTVSDYGGAVYFSYVDNSTISNTNFTNNTAEYRGGGAYLKYSHNASLTNVTFTNNTVKTYKNYVDGGGGAYIDGSNSQYVDGFSITDCNFTENTVYYRGGALFLNYVNNSLIKNTKFTNNTVSSGGGGGVCFNYTANASIIGTAFTNNSVGSIGGGALFIDTINIDLRSINFTNNTAGRTGGVQFRNCANIYISGTTFENNTASIMGGGAELHNCENASITNTTFANNTITTNYGGGAYFTNSANTSLVNTTFKNNTAPISGGGAYIVGLESQHIDGFSITDCNFTGNTVYRTSDLAGNDAYGGALYLYLINNSIISNTTFTNNKADVSNTSVNQGYGGGAYFKSSSNATIKNCFFNNTNNIDYSSSSSAKSLNETTPILGTNIAGGPYLGGNAWLQAPGQNISESGNDTNFDGICDQNLTITGFGTDYYPLVYGGENMGIVNITSVPAGALVYIDGNSTGRTTNASFYLPVGTHTFFLQKDELSSEKTIEIKSSENSDMIETLTHVTKIWNVSYHVGDGNVTNVSNISSFIGSGDLVRIWGEDGHTYEGGFTIDADNVSITRWDGSPELPIITNTSQTAPAVTVTGNNVTLRGLNISGNNLSSISGKKGAGVYVNGGSLLQGFNITDCVFTDNTVGVNSNNYGGAVYLSYVDNSRISNTIFTNNTANSGGSVYFSHSNNVIINSTTFVNNTANSGGSVYFSHSNNVIINSTTFVNNTVEYSGGGAYFSASDSVIINSTTFENNTAMDSYSGSGGGAYFSSSHNAIINSTTFVNNTAMGTDADNKGGGGAYFDYSDNASLMNITFTNNNATRGGGGAYFKGSFNATISGTKFVNNTATTIGGGGAYITGQSNSYHIDGFSITDCNFTGNTVKTPELEKDTYGGAISLYYVDNSRISNTTFTNNKADVSNTTGYEGYGGGAYFSSSHNASITNTNFTNNTVYGAQGRGGGAYIEGLDSQYLDGFNISDCNFTENTAPYQAGALWLKYVNKSNIINTNFTKNTVTVIGGGGGICFYYITNASVIGTTFNSNSVAGVGGGAIFSRNINLDFWNNNVTNNVANGRAGGIDFRNSDHVSVTNTIFNNNTAATSGGGVTFKGSTNASLVNTTFNNNTATIDGGGASIAALSSCIDGFNITECAFIGNIVNQTSDIAGNDAYGGALYLYLINNSIISNTTFTNNKADVSNTSVNQGYGGGAYFKSSSNATIKNCFFNNTNNIDYSSSSSAKSLNETTPILGTNIAGGPYLGGNVWLQAQGQNISESGNDTNFDGICDQNLTITGFGTDEYPLVYSNEEMGTVNITSDPSGAAVYIDGNNTNRTTNAIFYLPAGTHTIFLQKEELSSETTINVASETLSINKTLAHVTKTWNVSYVDINDKIFNNATNVSEISSFIGDNDTVRIWGEGGHIYEGGFTIDADNVLITRWAGSPEFPIITNTSQTAPAIKVTGNNATLRELNVSGNSFLNNQGAGVYVSNGSLLQGFNITDCIFTENSVGNGGSGGAVYLSQVDNSIISNTIFANNSAEYGGSAYFLSSSNASILNTTFVNNTGMNSNAGSGGGVYFLSSSNAIINSTTFENNTAMGSNHGGGGAYFLSSSNASINNTNFTNNKARNYGGSAYFDSSSNASIQNTNFTNNTAESNGGGAFFYLSSNASIQNTNFTNNTATNMGGGAYFGLQSDNASIQNTNFTNNTAKNYHGGGVYFYNSSTINNTKFTNNTAVNGGGAYFYSSSTINNTNFTNDTATTSGGGAYISNSDNATITCTKFTNDTATTSGGGAYISNSDNVTITSTNFTNNTVKNSHGGGAYISNSDNATITCTNFANNTAKSYGGGAYFYSQSNNASITNTTFVNNTAASGGGAYFWQSNNSIIKNCFFSNTKNIGFSSSSTKSLNETTPTLGTNIAGGPYLGGNVWLQAPGQDISDSGTDADFDGICDQNLAISGFGTDEYPLVYNSGMGTVNITSVPEGATVYIDGNNTNRTTNSTFYLPVGTHTFFLQKDELSSEKTIKVNSSENPDMVETLAHVTKTWNISYVIDGNMSFNNATNVSEISSFIGENDTIRIWGEEGHIYEGGFTIDADNVSIIQWGGSPELPVITNTSQTAPAITVTGNNVTLRGLNISRNNLSSENGAGVHVSGSVGSPLQGFNIIDCIFTENTVNTTSNKYKGGAVFLCYVDNSRIKNTRFVNNTAYNGGGACFTSSVNASIMNTNFANNKATQWGGGALLGGASNNASIMNTNFTNNNAISGGGAFFANINNASIMNTNFTSNMAANAGGAYFFSSNNATIKNCFFNNTNNIGSSSSTAKSLNETTPILGTNIAGGPYLGGNVWLQAPGQNISESGTDADFDGVCDQNLTIGDFGTDEYPLMYGDGNMGVLNITSVPEGAVVFINGSSTGRTTNSTFYLPFGTYNISLKKEYFAESVEIVTISSVQNADMKASLIQNEVPVPTLNVTPTGGFAPMSVAVNVSGEGKPKEWNLSHGDGKWTNGTSSDEINGTITYDKAGEYTLTLNVSTNGFFNETTKNITVEMPAPTLSVSATEGVAPLSIDVNVSGEGEPKEWKLSHGDGTWTNGTSSDQINGTITYTKAGEYTLTLNVSANGLFNQSSKKIKVNEPAPVQGPKLTVSPEEGLAPLAVQINVSGTEEYDSLNLSLGNGTWINGTTSDEINRTVTYEQAGAYTLTLNAYKNSVVTEINKTIKVKLPTPTLTVSPKEGVAPLEVQINVSGTEEYDSLNLSLGNGTWINGTSPDQINGTVIYEQAGAYTLILTASVNGVSVSSQCSKNVKVNPASSSGPELTVSPDEGFVPLTVQINVSSSNEYDSWNLSLGNGTWINATTSDQINRTVTYDEAGEYTLNLIAYKNGFFNETNKTIKVKLPTPTLVVSPNEGTAPLTVQINVSGSDESDSWNLSLGNGKWINGTSSAEINGTVTYDEAGEYTLTLTVSANGVSSQCSKNVKVNPASSPGPELTFSLEEGVAPIAVQIYVSGTEEYDSLNLSLGNGTWINGTSSDQINRTITYDEAGEYTLTLIAYKNGVAYKTSKTITAEMPAPTLTVSPEEGTVPLEVQINVSGAGKPEEWNLSLGNGTWINGTSPAEINGTVTYEQAGEYILKLNVSRNGFSNFSTVEVKALAQASSNSTSSTRKVSQGSHVSFQFSDSAIYMIELTTGETTPYFFFTVEDKDLPSGITAPPEAIAVYEYNEVSHSQVSNTSLTEVNLSFKVQKTWLEENGFASENVVLYRYHNGTWQALDTEVLDEDEDYVRFSAQSPGFSLFAIGVKAPEQASDLFTSPAKENESKNTTTEPENTKQKSPIWYGEAVLAIGAAYIFKKRSL